jgi:hypothetical protein
MDTFKGTPIITPADILTYQDKPYVNKFNEEFKGKWVVRTSGRHFQDAKILDSNAMAEIQDLKYKRFQESIFDYDWEIGIMPPSTIPNDFTTTYIGYFNSLFEAKEYLIKQRIQFVHRNISQIANLGITDEIIFNRYKQIQGLKKTERALKNWQEKHPEYFI